MRNEFAQISSKENPENLLRRSRYAFVFAVYNNQLKRDYLYSIPNAKNLMFIAASPDELAEKLYVAIRSLEQIELVLEQAYAFAGKQMWGKIANVYLELYQKKRVLVYD